MLYLVDSNSMLSHLGLTPVNLGDTYLEQEHFIPEVRVSESWIFTLKNIHYHYITNVKYGKAQTLLEKRLHRFEQLFLLKHFFEIRVDFRAGSNVTS